MTEQCFLSSGSFEGLRESGSFGRPLYSLYPQLKAVLERELGEDDSLLLAEPVVDEQRHLIDWYTQGTGKPVALSRLPENQRQQIHQRLVAAYDRLGALADSYRNSKEADKIQLGTALKAALVPPAEANVFLVEERPVVTFWGFFQDRDGGEPMDLAAWRDRYHQEEHRHPQPEPDTVPSVPAPITAVKPDNLSERAPVSPANQNHRSYPPPPGFFVVVGSRFFWSVVFGSMAMLALVVVLFLVGILPFEQTRNPVVRQHTAQSDASEALAHARETEGQLRAKLDDLLAAAAERKKQCTTSPPEAHTAPTQSSSAATAEDYRQFDERLAKAGAVSGEISVSLLWDNKNDLDLIIFCPSGKLLYYNNPSECGGTLDIDKNVSDLTDRPVENVYWPRDQAPAGTYRVAVKYYARKDFSLPAQSAFQVRLVEQGKLSLFKGTIGPEEMRPVTVFTVRP